MDFNNKTVLITGSSKGIGFSTAEYLKGLGATVILNSRSAEDLKLASEKLGNAAFFECDITDDKKTQEMINSVYQQFGKLDCLVNNAGGGGWASILDGDDEWQKSINLDLMGAVLVSRYVLPRMKEANYGSVVNISSLWGVHGTAKPEIASYCVSKAAIIKLTECLAQEWAPAIRVNSVAPGWTKTQMIMDDFNEEGIQFMQKNVLLNRLAEPIEIAKVIGFLLSDDASYITGQTISADGGYLLTRSHPKSNR